MSSRCTSSPVGKIQIFLFLPLCSVLVRLKMGHLSKIIWTVFEDRVFFLDQEPCISRPNSEFIWDHSLLVPLKLKRALWFFLTCVWWKKVWVNFKRKVLYFRSSNHTAGEIRPATKSDIEVKTVSVTSVVKFKGTEVTCCRFLDTFIWPLDLRTYFVCKNPVLESVLRHFSIVLL